MVNSYSSLCDAFFCDMHVNTELDLPCERDTVLTFFERIGKQFPAMGNFYRRDSGDFCLEEERGGSKYRYVSLELDRICSGCADPEDMDDAYDLHKCVLDLAPYMLGVSSLDVASLDVTYTMDFDFKGNHDEVVSEAFFGSTAFGSMLDLPDSRAIGFSPSVVIGLSKDLRTQARIAIESRTSVYDIRNERYKDNDPISLYFTIRRYPSPNERFDAAESFVDQCSIAENLMADKIVTNFIQPISSAIAQRR